MSGSVRLHLDGIVQALVDPQARNGHHPIVYLADATQVLLAYVRRGFSVFSVTGFVHHQSSAHRGSGPRILEHRLRPAPVYLLGGPIRLGEEPLKTLRLLALRPHYGFGVGKGSESLVSLGREQQSLKVAAKSLTLGQGVEQVVEVGSVAFEGAGSGLGGQASGHGKTSLPSLEHGGCPSSTNYRYSGGGCRARRRSTLRLSKAPTMPTAIVKHKKEDSRGRYADTRCLPHRGRTAPADSRRSLPTYGEARRGPGMGRRNLPRPYR